MKLAVSADPVQSFSTTHRRPAEDLQNFAILCFRKPESCLDGAGRVFEGPRPAALAGAATAAWRVGRVARCSRCKAATCKSHFRVPRLRPRCAREAASGVCATCLSYTCTESCLPGTTRDRQIARHGGEGWTHWGVKRTPMRALMTTYYHHTQHDLPTFLIRVRCYSKVRRTNTRAGCLEAFEVLEASEPVSNLENDSDTRTGDADEGGLVLLCFLLVAPGPRGLVTQSKRSLTCSKRGLGHDMSMRASR